MVAHSNLFKRSYEFIASDDIESFPYRVRGIYVLYKEDKEVPSTAGKKPMNVVYVGMARGEKSGVRGRLMDHRKKKKDLWSHCSVFEVWDNISPSLVEELEGMFRHIFRKDAVANKLNKQKAYSPLNTLAKETKANS